MGIQVFSMEYYVAIMLVQWPRNLAHRWKWFAVRQNMTLILPPCDI